MPKRQVRQMQQKEFQHSIKDGRQKPRPGIDEQRRLITDTALGLFLAKGLRSISITDICVESGVSRSTFYRCFDSIEQLVSELYSESVFLPVKEVMLSKFDKPMNSEILKQALDEVYEAIFEHGNSAALLFREANDPSSPAYAIVNNAFDEIVLLLQAVLPKVDGKKADAIYLKAILNANQWIAQDAIHKGLNAKNKQAAKTAAWLLVQSAFTHVSFQANKK